METIIIIPVSRFDDKQRLTKSLKDLKHDGTFLFYGKEKYIDSIDIKGYRVYDESEIETGIMERRKRVKDIHNNIQKIIPECRYIACIEDDTLVPSNSYFEMKNSLRHGVGFITALQVGRWGTRYIGAWIENDGYITSINNIKEKTKITGAGLYYFMTTRENYLRNKFEIRSDTIGADFYFGYNLTKQGFINYALPIHTTHMTGNEDVIIDDNIQIVRLRL